MQTRLASEKTVLLGTGLALVASVLYGASSVVAKKGMAEYDVPPIVFTAFSMLLGTFMVFLLAQRGIKSNLQAPRRYFLFMMAAGIASGAAVIFLTIAIKRAPVAVVTPLISLNPLFALILIHLFLQRLERVTLRTMAGTLMAMGGVVLIILGSIQL